MTDKNDGSDGWRLICAEFNRMRDEQRQRELEQLFAKTLAAQANERRPEYARARRAARRLIASMKGAA